MTKILILNIGSSSIKYDIIDGDNVLKSAQYETFNQSIIATLKLLLKDIKSDIQFIGHRIVHGGNEFCSPTILDKTNIDKLKALNHLAPLHNPIQHQCVEYCIYNTQAINIGFFDTAFHSTISLAAKTYAIPKKWGDLYKYGFHGLSHEYCSQYVKNTLPQYAKKIINCHLGNGSSICAIKDGKSIDTTMGTTPLAGLIMGTRSGDIDPGLFAIISKRHNLSIEEITHVLYSESGLVALCNTHDMRDILQDPKYKSALDIYCYRIVSYIASYIAHLSGIDSLIFTGGIGENSDIIRSMIIEKLKIFNIFLSTEANKNNNEIISNNESSAKIWVLKCQETLHMAKIIQNDFLP